MTAVQESVTASIAQRLREARRTPQGTFAPAVPFTPEELTLVRVIATGGRLPEAAIALGSSRRAAKYVLEVLYLRHQLPGSHTALVQYAAGRHVLDGVDLGDRGVVRLTSRAREILRLLGDGLTLQQIAAQLWLAPDTVKTHLKVLFAAIGAKTQAHAVALDTRWHYSADPAVSR